MPMPYHPMPSNHHYSNVINPSMPQGSAHMFAISLSLTQYDLYPTLGQTNYPTYLQHII
jgi:hypothetical protein